MSEAQGSENTKVDKKTNNKENSGKITVKRWRFLILNSLSFFFITFPSNSLNEASSTFKVFPLYNFLLISLSVLFRYHVFLACYLFSPFQNLAAVLFFISFFYWYHISHHIPCRINTMGEFPRCAIIEALGKFPHCI